MKNLSAYITRMLPLLFAAVAALLVSCHDRSGDSPLPDGPDSPQLILRFNIPRSVAAGAGGNAADGYVKGSREENLVDVYGNCEVLFFNMDNVFVGKLDKTLIADVEGSDYTQYNVGGIPPENLPADFKLMVIANWPDISEAQAAVVGTTKIDDICHSLSSQFAVYSDFILDAASSRLMPFYGIHSYSGVDWKPGTSVSLDEPVTLLRAMAKIEVNFEATDGYRLGGVTLSGYNQRGYCAPSGVYSQNDYGQGNDWSNDYLRRLHLVSADNNNDAGAASRTLPLRHCGDGDSQSWIAYVPEYRNLRADGSPAADEASLLLTLVSPTGAETPFRLFFADYSGTSSADNSVKRYNIERNNIYRFDISLHDGRIEIFARPWNYRPQPEIEA